MLLHSLGHSDDAWDLAWLSVVVAARRHEGLVYATAAERETLADAATRMVDAASVAACVPGGDGRIRGTARRRGAARASELVDRARAVGSWPYRTPQA